MFVVQSAVVKGRGGIATAVAHYESMFRAVGVRSAVVFSGPSIDTLRQHRADVLEAPTLLTSPLGGVLPLFSDLKAELCSRAGAEPIVVIAHSDLTMPSLRRMLPQARFVTPCHSDKTKHKGGADLVIALNAAQRDHAVASLPGVPVALLGNPYVVEPIAPLPPTGAPPRFNFVGRFIETKDPLLLARAAVLMEPRASIRFIGDGELADKLRALCSELGLTEAELPGWSLAPFSEFHRNDILVLPSHWEGLPYLLQEALDHGVPTIAADNAGNRTALGDGAYGALFPIGNEAALAEAMRAALADLDGLRAKADKGRAALRARYGAEPFWRALTAELEKARAHA